MVGTICTEGAGLIETFVLPLIALSTAITAIIIAISYMVSEVIHNPKLTLWAKTEIVQLVFSVAATLIILGTIPVFCAVNLSEVYGLFEPGVTPPAKVVSIFDGAEAYLTDAAIYIHYLINAARYHLAGYNIFENFGRFVCGPWSEGRGLTDVGNVLFCTFGSFLGMGGGAGYSYTPDSGYALTAPALQVAFNSLFFSYLSALNYLFILRYIFSGFIFFFLPLGIMLRAMPYIRPLGSLLIAVSFCFLVIYPFILSVFYIDFLNPAGSVLKPAPSDALKSYFTADVEGVVGISDAFDNNIHDDVFESGDMSTEIIGRTGNAFLMAVFIPSLALLAAAAAVSYINRFLGEEIDLSRMVQMV